MLTPAELLKDVMRATPPLKTEAPPLGICCDLAELYPHSRPNSGGDHGGKMHYGRFHE